ncbi:PTS lactose transporter subunit IIBC [Collinsella tanakaei]|uniref:PTS lactose transporter subunit IIBC n=1 Tax=Collinsella tanakaei TaxID=626935 RepID=UPI0022E89CE2|nr:PTS lactose transporter subunit IIBC [Collinsella tanakaei]
MNVIVSFLERHQKFFDKISKNIYLVAIKDGFLSNMPIVLFSSLFLLLATLPEYVGVALPQEILDFCNKIYAYTMGVLGIMVAGTTASSLTLSMNRRMPAGKVINATSTMVTAMCCMLLLSATNSTVEIGGASTSVFDTTYMGTKGLISSFVSAFLTVNIYKLCIKHNITIKMPKEVPGTIAQSFRDIFAFGFSVLACALIDVAVRQLFSVPFANVVSTLLSPLFTAVDTYPGLAIIESSVALFQFMGIHGGSVVMTPINAALYDNTAINLATYQAGGHPDIALTLDFTNFFAGLGGSGVTFIVPIILMLLMRSKQLKAIGKASFIPVLFGVNEPVLFGMPIVLNPYMFVPFLLAPACNAVITKFFIDVIGMNAPIYTLPWALPGPLGCFLTTGMQPISLLCVLVLLAVDFLVYYPFCKAYDHSLCQEEASEADGGELEQLKAEESRTEALVDKQKASGKQIKVLVLCQGAGTSTLLANALKEGAEQKGIDLVSNSGAYGSHYDIMSGYNVVVLAPQCRIYYDEMKADTDRLGIKLLSTRGKQYINLTNDPEGAINWILNELNTQ